MRTLLAFASVLSFALGCSSPTAPTSNLATVEPLPAGRSIDLADHSGSTFFEVMTQDGGIADSLNADYAEEFVVADRDAMVAARDRFSDKVNRKVTKPFGTNGLNKFLDFIDGIAGDSYTPSEIKSVISREGVTPWAIADYVTMASGASTLVYINTDNYYYNVSYEAAELKSGRSFGAGPEHPADDASYPFYLDELSNHLENSPDVMPLYTSIFKVLTQSDVAGVDNLDSYSQTVLTDFVTIYTAELFRHYNAGLAGSAPWENDLAEATMLSIWNHAVGKVQKDGEIVEGTPRDWNGFGDNGSGVGITRKDRRSLQIKVCNAVRELNPGVVEEFEQYLANERPDCYRAVMEFLNNEGTQADVHANAKDLTKAVVAFLKFTRDNADNIMNVMTH